MKLIPYVPTLYLTNTRREPLVVTFEEEIEEAGEKKKVQKTKQASLSQRELFVQRLEDADLVKGKEPIVASKFSNAIYDAIAEQTDEAVAARGGWKFEDEHADALCRVVKKGPPNGYNMAVLHCLVPMLEAVEKAKPWKDSDAKPNGAERALPEVAQA